VIVLRVRRRRLDPHRRSHARIAFSGRDASGKPRSVTRRIVLRRR
jgi:hypothetical protein